MCYRTDAVKCRGMFCFFFIPSNSEMDVIYQRLKLLRVMRHNSDVFTSAFDLVKADDVTVM